MEWYLERQIYLYRLQRETEKERHTILNKGTQIYV